MCAVIASTHDNVERHVRNLQNYKVSGNSLASPSRIPWVECADWLGDGTLCTTSKQHMPASHFLVCARCFMLIANKCVGLTAQARIAKYLNSFVVAIVKLKLHHLANKRIHHSPDVSRDDSFMIDHSVPSSQRPTEFADSSSIVVYRFGSYGQSMPSIYRF